MPETTAGGLNIPGPLRGESYLRLIQRVASYVAKWPAWKTGSGDKFLRCSACGPNDACDNCPGGKR